MKIRATHSSLILLLLWWSSSLFALNDSIVNKINLPFEDPPVTVEPRPLQRSFDFAEELLPLPPPPGDTDNLIGQLVQLEEVNANLATIQAARQKIGKAISLGNFLQRLDSLAWIEFPVVLADTISNVPIAIVFDALRLYPDYAQLAVVIRMELPQRKVGATTGQGGTNTGNNNDDTLPPTEYVELFFGTPNLKFSHDGGIIGDAIAGLYSDTPIGSSDPSKFGMILRPWHEYGSGSNSQGLGTYVRIDCDGFVEMGVEADVLFSRDWIVPVDGNATPLADTTRRVNGHIQTVINDWQNMLVEISLPNFAPTAYPDIAFNLSTAVFDFSDFRNSPDVVFPPAYAQQNLMPSNPSLWRGVYIRNLDVTLPKQVKKKGCQPSSPGGSGSGTGTGMLMLDEQGTYAYGYAIDLGTGMHGGPSPTEMVPFSAKEAYAPPEELLNEEMSVENCRTSVGVEHLLIDGHGVSGHFYAQEVLNINDGSMDGWRYSLSDLEIELVASDVVGFGFGGEVGIPIAKENQNFGYSAFVNIPARTFNFTVITGQDYNFPVFKMADVTIEAGSYLQVTASPTKFEPVAVLFGFATIKGKMGSSQDDSQLPADSLSLRAPRINFHKLRLATTGTKLSLMTGGYISFASEIRVLGYPVPIADPTLTALPGGKLKLTVDVSFNLMNQEDNGFSVESSVDVKGALQTTQGIDEWNSDGLVIGSILVDIKLPALEIFGYAHIFDNDPVYGKGFQGSLSVKIGEYTPPGDPMLTVELNAIFGRTDFKYWYVDGFVEWNTSVPGIVLGPIEINGFGGGAYYHMKMASADIANGSTGGLGTMSSGVTYEPYLPTVLGLKATVAFKSPGTDVLDGVATLELRFSGTGLQEIMFYGKAEIVPPNGIGGAGLTKFSDGLRDRINDLPKPKAQTEAEDEAEVNNPYDRILATAFIRMNFEQGFEFQGTFRAFISAAQGVIVGQGGVDFLFSTPQNRWHIYVGGYSNNMIIAGDGVPLPPISVGLNLGEGITAGADAYFLTGNDIPGPPPLHPMAAAYFGITQQPPDNRNQLGSNAAAGMGFAFGAAIYAHIEKRIRNGGSYNNNRLSADVGAGFDVALLKYATNTRCSLSNTSPHGHKGWRATGRIWAYIDGHARYRGIGKSLSIGVLIQADLPKPVYLNIRVRFTLVINIDVNVEIGDECGPPVYN